MLVLLSWLNDYLDKKIDIKDEAAVRNLILTMDNLGLVTESVKYVGDDLDGVILAQVSEINPIKNKDRIRQIFVDAGPDKKRVEVVCGAWNFQVGDVVPFATVGTVLPNKMVIAQKSLGGVTSNGMLCSKSELGIGEDHAGIDIVYSPPADSAPLPPGLVLGMNYSKYLGFGKDVVLDLAVEPNRPDALSMYGIARDIAPKIGANLIFPDVNVTYSDKVNPCRVSVTIEDDDACDHFGYQLIDNIKIAPSSRKIAYRLTMAGMRPINSVVDASNYVMLELGRPSHFYDTDYLSAKTVSTEEGVVDSPDIAKAGDVDITIRWAMDGESIVTLDGQERVLHRYRNDMGEKKDINLLVSNGDKIIALAGVMGDIHSEVGEKTKSILLEVADFDAKAVLRTSRLHQLRSEASLRFERGIDPATTVLAGERICQMLAESAGENSLASPFIWPMVITGKRKHEIPRKIVVSLQRISKLLAHSFTFEQVANLLEPIGFKVSDQENQEGELLITIPSFRPDVEVEVDIVEEIARHYGYENFSRTLPRSKVVGRLNPYQDHLRTTRRTLAGLCLSEAWTNTLIDKNTYPFHREELVELLNPLTSEENALRSSILPGLLTALKRNISYRNPYVRLFEIGHIFRKKESAGLIDDNLLSQRAKSDDYVSNYLEESEEICCLLAGSDDDGKKAYRTFLSLADTLKIDEFSFDMLDPKDIENDLKWQSFIHPSRSKIIIRSLKDQSVILDGGSENFDIIGVVGEIHPHLKKLYEITNPRVAFLLLDAKKLFSLEKKSLDAVFPSIYPSSDIDLCFISDYAITARDIQKVLTVSAKPYLESICLLDTYSNKDSDQRSLTFRLRLSSANGTLSEQDVRAIWQSCVDSVSNELNIKLRDS